MIPYKLESSKHKTLRAKETTDSEEFLAHADPC